MMNPLTIPHVSVSTLAVEWIEIIIHLWAVSGMWGLHPRGGVD